jgi:hypothetical protein
MKVNGKLIAFTLILIATATLCKIYFAPKYEWSGFSPIIAIALFSGMMSKDKSSSFLLPLLSIFISDVIIDVLHRYDQFPFAGLYKHQFFNYTLLLATTLIGWALKGRNYTSLFAGAIAAPTLFFLVSNFNVWVTDIHGAYSPSISGLMTCYAAGLPFYKHALTATLLFVPAIAFTYNYLLKKRMAIVLQ